jgi:tRNA threonylcarbamoyl adenosine modification protein (Sua5/YciO/YrdC/YwlC family)
VPRRVTSRRTIGVRIPGHAAAHALLADLDEPMLSTTLTLAGESAPLADAQEIRARLERRLDLIIDGGPCGTEPSTVIDLTGATPQVLRQGRGSLAPFAVEPV